MAEVHLNSASHVKLKTPIENTFLLNNVETENDAVIEKVYAEVNILGFTILKVSTLKWENQFQSVLKVTLPKPTVVPNANPPPLLHNSTHLTGKDNYSSGKPTMRLRACKSFNLSLILFDIFS